MARPRRPLDASVVKAVRPRSRRRLATSPPLLYALLASTIAVLIVQLDGRTVPAAIPTMADELGTTSAALQWVMSGWLLAAAASLIVGGRLADIFGRRRLLLLGALILISGSLIGGLAGSAEILIIGRVFQGAGSAIMYPTALAVVTNAFGRDGVQRALGRVLTAGAIGVAVGALLGGILTDVLGWRAVLLVNVPVAILVIGLAWRGVAESRDPTAPRSVDLLGAVLISSSVGAVMLAIDLVSDHGWFDLRAMALMALGGLGLIAFAFVERRVRFPLLELDLLRDRVFASVAVAGSVGTAPTAVIAFVMLVFLQDVRGLSAIEASIIFTTFAVGQAAAAMTSGRLGMIPPWAVMSAALGVGGVGTIGMGLFSQPILFAGFGVVSGYGLGLSFAYLNIVSQTAVPARLAGAAAGTAFTLLIISTAMALAVAVSAFDTLTSSAGVSPPTAISVILIASGMLSVGAALLFVASGRARTEARGIAPEQMLAIESQAHDVADVSRPVIESQA